MKKDTPSPDLNLIIKLERKLNKDSPEQCLFIAVILQALLDASKPTIKGEDESITYERQRAKAWFFAPVGVTCQNFEVVCDNADLSPSYVRSFAYKVLQSGEIEYVRKRINKILNK